jgi:hypothetical protein
MASLSIILLFHCISIKIQCLSVISVYFRIVINFTSLFILPTNIGNGVDIRSIIDKSGISDTQGEGGRVNSKSRVNQLISNCIRTDHSYSE